MKRTGSVAAGVVIGGLILCGLAFGGYEAYEHLKGGGDGSSQGSQSSQSSQEAALQILAPNGTIFYESDPNDLYKSVQPVLSPSNVSDPYINWSIDQTANTTEDGHKLINPNGAQSGTILSGRALEFYIVKGSYWNNNIRVTFTADATASVYAYCDFTSANLPQAAVFMGYYRLTQSTQAATATRADATEITQIGSHDDWLALPLGISHYTDTAHNDSQTAYVTAPNGEDIMNFTLFSTGVADNFQSDLNTIGVYKVTGISTTNDPYIVGFNVLAVVSHAAFCAVGFDGSEEYALGAYSSITDYPFDIEPYVAPTSISGTTGGAFGA